MKTISEAIDGKDSGMVLMHVVTPKRLATDLEKLYRKIKLYKKAV